MGTDLQQVTRQQKFVNGMGKAGNTHPAIVYLLLGCLCLFFWAIGTSTQVLTSEAWMMKQTMNQITFSAFGQLWDAAQGHLSGDMQVPFLFGWGVQMALIFASIGVELPRKPAWRFYLSMGSCFVLIVTNSCGDYAGSASYGFWGQWGFTAVIFFLTFVMMILAIEAFKKAFRTAKEAMRKLEN
jgi:hypothetical protein